MFIFTYTAAILSIICFGVAFFILMRGYDNLLSRYLGLYVFSVAIFNGATALADVSVTELSYRFWSGLVLAGGLFFIAFFLCFTEYFTTEKPLTLAQKIIIFFPATIMACLGFTRLCVDEVFFPPNMPAQNTMGILQYPILIYTFSAMLFAFIRLMSHIRSTQYQKRLQSIYITVGFFVVLIAAATFSVILPVFGEYRFFSVAPQFSIFMIALAAYAIFKHKLLNIKLIIQKSVIYIILIGVVVGVYLIIVSLLSFSATFYNSSYQPLAVIAASFLGAVGVPPLKSFLKRKTDKLFFKDHMPYADAVNELSSVMNSNLEINDLLDSTASTLHSIFKPLDIKVYLIREKTLYEWSGSPFSTEARISKTEDFDFMPGDDDKLYVNAEHDGAILAQIVIGEKKSGDIYLPEDRSIMTTFSYQFAMALQKTFLFEQVKKHTEQLAKKIHKEKANRA